MMFGSDLMIATGWLTDHPKNGRDLAHLFFYPGTDFDPDTRLKVAELAGLYHLGPMDAERTAFADVRLDVPTRQLWLFGEAQFKPIDNLTAPWLAAAVDQGLIVLTLTAKPMSAPTVGILEQTLLEDPSDTWVGVVELTTRSNL